jgi:Flp pilus assembly protein TadD
VNPFSRRTAIGFAFVFVAVAARANAQQAELPPEANQADSLMKAKDFAAAAKLYERLVAKLPKAWAMWRGLALSSYQTKDYARAATAFENVAELTSLPTPLYNAGVSHALAGHDSVAFAFLSRAAVTGKIPVNNFVSDPDLERLRKDKRFEAVLATAQKSAAP